LSVSMGRSAIYLVASGVLKMGNKIF